jgi:hypothetical protein
VQFVGAIVLLSTAAAIASVALIFRAVHPPDSTAAVLGGLWIALPYLAAVGLAVLLRRRTPVLVALVVGLALVAPVGIYLLKATAQQQEQARQQVATSVGPGEDPSHGPAGMRKAGAEMGEAVGSVFSILLAVVLPPVQLAVVLIAAGIGLGVSAWSNRRPPAGDFGETPDGSLPDGRLGRGPT